MFVAKADVRSEHKGYLLGISHPKSEALWVKGRLEHSKPLQRWGRPFSSHTLMEFSTLAFMLEWVGTEQTESYSLQAQGIKCVALRSSYFLTIFSLPELRHKSFFSPEGGRPCKGQDMQEVHFRERLQNQQQFQQSDMDQSSHWAALAREYKGVFEGRVSAWLSNKIIKPMQRANMSQDEGSELDKKQKLQSIKHECWNSRHPQGCILGKSNCRDWRENKLWFLNAHR